MWAFNVATSLWRNVTYSGSVVPPPVFRHKGTVAGNSLYVFGGEVCNITEAFYCNATTYLNTTWSFDFTTSTWQELTNAIMPLVNINLRYWVVKLTLLFIQPRTGHSLATVNDGQELVLFGGVPYNNKIQLNDIWVFNIAEANWTESMAFPILQNVKSLLTSCFLFFSNFAISSAHPVIWPILVPVCIQSSAFDRGPEPV